MKKNTITVIVFVASIVVLLGPSLLILAQKSQNTVTNGYYIEQIVLHLLPGLFLGFFETGLDNIIIKQSEVGKPLPKFLNLFLANLIFFVLVHIYLLVVSTLAMRLAEWISHPFFRTQNKFGTSLLYSFLAWFVGFWIGYAIQSIPRIHKSMESLAPAPEIVKESPVLAEVDDMQAIREYCRAAALQWWNSNNLESVICDKCNGAVSRNSGYIIGSWLYCGECEDMFSEQYRYYFKSDPNFYGQGVLEKARKRMLET